MADTGGAQSEEDAFAEEAAAAARHYLGAQVERGPDFTLRITRPDNGDRVTMHLSNVFAESRPLTDDARRALLQRAALAAVPPPAPTTWAEAAPLLMPAVRGTSWHRSRPDVKPVVTEPMLPHLDLSIAIDSLYAIMYVSADDPGKWSVDWATLRAQAVSNLARNDPQLVDTGEALLVTGPDGYASSWLAVPEALGWIGRSIGPEVLVFVPGRDHLRMVNPTNTEAVLSAQDRAIADFQSDPRRIAPSAYLVKDGRVWLWQPPQGHPATGPVHRAWHLHDAYEYGSQQESLENELEEDVWVASYNLVEAEGGGVFSYAVWGEDVDALVPRVDYLVLTGQGGAIDGAVPWQAAIDVAGAHLVQAPGYRPGRWRYSGWPPPQVLGRLRDLVEPPRAH